MTKLAHGRVRGNSIELDEAIGIPEGQEVEVQVRVIGPNPQWGEGIRRSAGGWENAPEMDAIMDRIQSDRKLERRPQLED